MDRGTLHMDMKSANVFLDSQLNGKIGGAVTVLLLTDSGLSEGAHSSFCRLWAGVATW